MKQWWVFLSAVMFLALILGYSYWNKINTHWTHVSQISEMTDEVYHELGTKGATKYGKPFSFHIGCLGMKNIVASYTYNVQNLPRSMWQPKTGSKIRYRLGKNVAVDDNWEFLMPIDDPEYFLRSSNTIITKNRQTVLNIAKALRSNDALLIEFYDDIAEIKADRFFDKKYSYVMETCGITLPLE